MTIDHAMTVPEIARRVNRHPETIRRWIREGRLPARKIGLQHMVEERDLADVIAAIAQPLPLPDVWRRTASGASMPDVAGAVRRSRSGH